MMTVNTYISTQLNSYTTIINILHRNIISVHYTLKKKLYIYVFNYILYLQQGPSRENPDPAEILRRAMTEFLSKKKKQSGD